MIKQDVVKDFEIHPGERGGWIELSDGTIISLVRANMENWKSLRGLRVGKKVACDVDSKGRAVRIYHLGK